jgi:hypothetical protein
MQTFQAIVVSGFVAFGAWTGGCSEPAAADHDDGGAAGGAPAASEGQKEDLACEPSSEDGACDACTRSTCCAELEDYLGAPGVGTFEACLEPCADQECGDACAEATSVAGEAYAGLDRCQRDSCAEPCVCEATAEESSCLACVKQKCCSDLVPYALASDFDGFSACMEPCTDRTCADVCIAEFPDAGPAYAAYSDCAFEACPSECE